ncbi:hypothetical protein HAZT_HAZT000896 [Hyalella azteca]|nr:hypothetical protein HAZT_HAZT000896 [Hyalella azteca]
MFRHLLNYMRHGRLLLPDDFSDFDLLLEEARFFELSGLVRQIEELRRQRNFRSKQQIYNNNNNISSSSSNCNSSGSNCNSSGSNCISESEGVTSCGGNFVNGVKKENCAHDVVAINVSPDLGERVMVSGERGVVEELFPEVACDVIEGRGAMAWNHDPKFIIRFPLNGYCKLNSMEAVQRLLSASFRVLASNGGGVEGQQFSEYIFYRQRF